MLVRLVELVAHERCHTRLDPARPQRDQRQPGVKSETVRDKDRQAGVPCTIDQAQPEDRVVFSKEPVRDPSAKQRKKVNADDESVEYLLGRAPPLRLGQVQEKRSRE